MRLRVIAGMTLILFLAPVGSINAQTVDIQEEITIKLWFQRLLQRLADGGTPTIFVLFALLAVALVLLGAMWLRHSRETQPGKPDGPE